MSKKAAAAATPAAGVAALACGNAACGKALTPPLLQCSKCKGEAYCCKACQVGDPAAPPRTARRTRLLAHPRPLPSPLPAPPRHQIAAWKAGHKHKCGAPGQGAAAAQLRRAAQGGAQLEASRAPAGLTAQQRRLKTRLNELQDADRVVTRLGALQAARARHATCMYPHTQTHTFIRAYTHRRP